MNLRLDYVFFGILVIMAGVVIFSAITGFQNRILLEDIIEKNKNEEALLPKKPIEETQQDNLDNNLDLSTTQFDHLSHQALIDNVLSNVDTSLQQLANLILLDENIKLEPYLDPNGSDVSIGAGRNLTGKGISIDELHALRPDIDYKEFISDSNFRIRNGRIYISTLSLANKVFPNELSPSDVEVLLMDDLKDTLKEGSSVFPRWSEIRPERREAIVDVIYTLGLPTFKEFVKFIDSVKIRDWETAGKELLLSDAAHQDPARYFRNSQIIRTGNRIDLN